LLKQADSAGAGLPQHTYCRSPCPWSKNPRLQQLPYLDQIDGTRAIALRRRL